MRAFALATTLLLTVPALAHGRPVPESDWDEATKLKLAQIMVGEADWHEPDHVAIAYVLARRWPQFQQMHGPISFAWYIGMYSSVMKVDSKRTRWVRGLPWGDITGPYAKRWHRVVELVEAWGEGRVKDPCPDAAHWGGAMDRPGKSWEPVSCGLTKNIFYTHRDRRVASR
ncbi:MAG TPA: hypothetical protein VI299_16060 [Polyangiales bacterium]